MTQSKIYPGINPTRNDQPEKGSFFHCRNNIYDCFVPVQPKTFRMFKKIPVRRSTQINWDGIRCSIAGEKAGWLVFCYSLFTLILAQAVLYSNSPLSAGWSQRTWYDAGKPWAMVKDRPRAQPGLCVLSVLAVPSSAVIFWWSSLNHTWNPIALQPAL